MKQASTAPPIIVWGERTFLLEKSMVYVFSLDLHLEVPIEQMSMAPMSDGMRLRARLATRKPDATYVSDPGWDTYHVLDNDLTKTADGRAHEVPTARVDDAQDWIHLRKSGVADLDGRLRLKTDDNVSISVEYTGALRFPGSVSRLFKDDAAHKTATGDWVPPVVGGAFIASRHDTSHPKYRWLAQTQLLGFGKAYASLLPESKDESTGRKEGQAILLELSYDLYSGG